MAKPTFLLNDGSETVTSFKVNVGDGDLNISANGIDIVFIEATTGKLHRFSVSASDQRKLPALKFGEDGRIVVQGS